MIMDEKLNITVSIADKRYPLTIKREDEENIRKAEALLKERILQYRQHFDAGNADILAMTAFQFAVQNIEMEDSHDNSPIFDQIEEMNLELAKRLG